jgi:hypothetical protein
MLDAGSPEMAENLETQTAVSESKPKDKPPCEQYCPWSEPKPASHGNSLWRNG